MKQRVLLFFLAGLLLCPALSALAWGPQNIVKEASLPAEAQALLESASYVQAIEENPYLYLLTENAQKMYVLTILKQTDTGFLPQTVSAPLPVMNGIAPSIIASIDSVSILYSEALIYTFEPDTEGVWRLTYVQGEHDYRCTEYWLIEQFTEHDRMLCSADPSPALSRFNPAHFPPGIDAAAQIQAGNACALVNNPDPADRLNLRAEPNTAADSKGKYYNGAPVWITADLGDWVKCSIAGIDGYMMKQYLAIGTNMLHVESAFPDLFIAPSFYGVDLTVYTVPDYDGETAGILTDCGAGRVTVTTIGIAGSDWVHVICGNGLAGYMPITNFYPGNG